jgi:hypothetical protein
VAERGEVRDDLPARVGGVGDDAGQAGHLPVQQDDGSLFGQFEQVLFGQAAARQHEALNRGLQPLGVRLLKLRALLGVAEDEGVAGRPGLGLGPSDDAEVARVGYVGHQQGEHGHPARVPDRGRPVVLVAQPRRHGLHVLPGGRADPVRIGQRPRSRGYGDSGVSRDVLQGHRPAPARGGWLLVDHVATMAMFARFGKHCHTG